MPMQKGGFSLVELLVAAVILSLLTGLVLPNSQSWLARQRRDGALQGLLHGLELARAGAVAKGEACAMALTASGWAEPLSRDLPPCSGVRDLTASAPDVLITPNNSNDLVIGPTGLVTGAGTVVVGHNHLEQQRCLVIAPPLGTVRVGIYDKDREKCVKDKDKDENKN